MVRDEHGMPLPDERILPIAVFAGESVVDRDGEEIEMWVDPEFFVHAANNIIPAREIVRRLAEWWENKEHPIGSLGIEAAELWAKMQKEVSDADS